VNSDRRYKQKRFADRPISAVFFKIHPGYSMQMRNKTIQQTYKRRPRKRTGKRKYNRLGSWSKRICQQPDGGGRQHDSGRKAHDNIVKPMRKRSHCKPTDHTYRT
jgi:hypothetical protein